MVNRIRTLCKSKGITIAQLEKALGFGNGTISKWGSSSKMPTYDRVVAVADFLGATADWIVYGAGNEPSPSPETSKSMLLKQIESTTDKSVLLDVIATATKMLQQE